MYYLLTGIIAVSILRYFNLIPKMTSKFWTYVDYALVFVTFVYYCPEYRLFLQVFY